MPVTFKVGDRVCCYGQNMNGWFDVINEGGDYGTITGACGPAGVEVTMDNDYGGGRVCMFHPKQCRRLKPKRKAREFIGEWVELLQTDVFASNFGKMYLAFIPISSTGIATGPMILKHSLPKKAKP